MKKNPVLFFVIFVQFLIVSCAYSAEIAGSASVQMDNAETIIYGEAKRGGLMERLNDLESVLFGRSLPGSLSERQLQLLHFIKSGSSEQPSLLFKLGVAEWGLSQSIQPFTPALGRLQKLEQELDGFIQEGKPVAMRVERVLSMLLTDPVTQVELEISSDKTVRAQFLEDIGPGTSRKGDRVRMELLEDYMMDNCLVAPKGSQIVSEVTAVVRPGAFGRRGEVKLELKHLQILGPEEPKVKFVDPKQLTGRGEKNLAAAVGASLGAAFLLGPLGLATGLLIRGESLDIKNGTQFFVQLDKSRLSVFPIPSGLRLNDNSSGDGISDFDNSNEILIPSTPE